MFTWVSRRRVTASLGAARCDDLRRYYAENNKVVSLTYKYRHYADRTRWYTIHVLRAWNREISSSNAEIIIRSVSNSSNNKSNATCVLIDQRNLCHFFFFFSKLHSDLLYTLFISLLIIYIYIPKYILYLFLLLISLLD